MGFVELLSLFPWFCIAALYSKAILYKQVKQKLATKPGKLKPWQHVPPRTKQFLAKVKAFCDQEYGRRAKLARFLGIQRQAVTNLLNERQNPTGEQVLAIMEWLDKTKGAE